MQAFVVVVIDIAKPHGKFTDITCYRSRAFGNNKGDERTDVGTERTDVGG